MVRGLRCLAAASLLGCAAPERPVVTPPSPGVAPAPELVERFTELALTCVHREYPNLIHHVLSDASEVRPPHELTPVFYGCYDWHSAVHGHWLLVRLLRLAPEAPTSAAARAALAQSLTSAQIAAEVEYVAARPGFERPYGLAWLLQLATELHGFDDPEAAGWRRSLAPLVALAVEHLSTWLVKLDHPIRSGEHAQTAFAMGLALDHARAVHDEAFEALLVERAHAFHTATAACPIDFEPSGHDFLSPCLGEADLMRRVLEPEAFAAWLSRALPEIPKDGSTAWLPVAESRDRSDGKLSHLDGLNLSRAWMLEGVALGLPPDDPRRASLLRTAAVHREAGLAQVSGEHYAGGHWLGSFAVYLVTGRGL